MSLKFIDLTELQKKIFLAMIDADNLKLSGKQIAENIGVHPGSFYRITANANFRKLVNDTIMDQIDSEMGKVMRSTFKYALKEPNHSDRKMLLEMFGYYINRKEVDLKVPTFIDDVPETDEVD